jgi:glycosyltransferase involved in cell wall biosynthesis
MHVLLITERWPPDRGGMAQSCDRTVNGLRARGVRVDVAVFTHRHASPRTDCHERGRVLWSPLDEDPGHTIQRLWNTVTLDAELAGLTHVVAFGGILPIVAAPAFAAWLDRPLVTLLRGNEFDVGLFAPRRGDAIREAVLRSARVCTVSRDHERKLAALFPGVPVVCVPNGIDTRTWTLSAADMAAARAWRAAKVAPGRRVLGLIGHLKAKKGVPFFLDVLRSSGHADRVHLLMAGEIEAGLADALKDTGDGLQHDLVAPVDRWQLLPYFAACDAVVIPSFYDGLPNVLLEAGALGIPVVASTAGGMADVLIDGVNALTFHPGDVHGCRRAIDRVVRASAEELGRLGAALGDVIARNFTATREAESYVVVLRQTQTRGRTPIVASPQIELETRRRE